MRLSMFVCVVIFIIVGTLIYFSREWANPIHKYDSLDHLHQKLHFAHGNLKDELYEQQMIFKHIKPDSKILEFGPNIGRSSVVANSLLGDKTQHLCIETIPDTCQKLRENRDKNSLGFRIFEGAVSKKKLYQSGWLSSSEQGADYVEVNTSPFYQIQKDYQIPYNTIIADCEGCLIPFLKENTSFLNQIRLIILEHDFHNREDLEFFNQLMNEHHFNQIDQTLKKDIGLEDWADGIREDPIFVSVWSKDT